jgi:predicted Zn-dependent protease
MPSPEAGLANRPVGNALLAMECAQRATHRGKRRLSRRIASTLAMAASALVLPLLAAAATPDEDRWARQVATRVEAHFGLLHDPERLARVITIGQRLEEAAGLPRGHLTWRLLDTPQFNALSIPGDRIYVARGLIDSARSEAELAAALAHEIAHITLGHTRQVIEERAAHRRITLVIENPLPDGTMSRRIVVAEGPKAPPGARRKELEADREAIRILKRAGYPPKAILSMLSRLGAPARDPSGGTQVQDETRAILSSHPSPDDRIRHARHTLQAITRGTEATAEASTR